MIRKHRRLPSDDRPLSRPFRATAQLTASVVAILMGCVAASTNRFADGNPPTENALSDSVWFDADKHETIPVVVVDESSDSVNRNSRWLPEAKKLRRQPSGQGGGNFGGGGLFGTSLTIWNLFGWLLLFALIVAAIALVALLASRMVSEDASESRSRSTGVGETVDDETRQRMQHLPAELRRTDVNMRSEAKRLMNQGQFDQAIILLLGHQLLTLDKAGFLRLNRGKTNGRYIRETRSMDPEMASRLRQTTTAFERSYFGCHSLSASEFQSLWINNQAIEAAIVEKEEVAA